MSPVVARRSKAIALIKAGKISSQGDLVKELKKAGFSVTQATASRDLEEIGAVRGRDGYILAEATTIQWLDLCRFLEISFFQWNRVEILQLSAHHQGEHNFWPALSIIQEYHRLSALSQVTTRCS